MYIRKKEMTENIRWIRLTDFYKSFQHTFSNYQSYLYIKRTRPNIVDDPKFRKFHKFVIRFEIINPLSNAVSQIFNNNIGIILKIFHILPSTRRYTSHFSWLPRHPILSQHHDVLPRRLRYHSDISVPLIAVSSFPLNCPETLLATRNCCPARVENDSFQETFHGGGALWYNKLKEPRGRNLGT